MLSPDTTKLLRFMRRNKIESSSFAEIGEHYGWSAQKVRSVCDQMEEAGYAKKQINHGTHGESFADGIVLKEEGRYYWRYFAIHFVRRCFEWFTAHIIELAALILSIIALIRTL